MKPVPCIRAGLALLALAVSVELPAAPLGTGFTYQGRLQQSGGPASGLYDFQSSVWDADTAGAPVGAIQTASVVGVTNGLFTVTLDFGSVFDGSARWLEIVVRTNGASGFITLAPRQPLTPTPYAILAGAASGLSGTLPVSQVSGVVPLAQLPLAVMTNYASSVSLSGFFTGNFGGSFYGNGGGLTGLNPTNLSAGTAAINISGNAATATTANSASSVAATGITGTIPPANLGAGTITSTMLAAGSVTTSALADGAVTLGKLPTALAHSGSLSITFTNPTPPSAGQFGYAVAAVGTDKVLIGTPGGDAGVAYLLSTNGTLLTTFTNPTPASAGQFGYALAAVGTDKVLIATPYDNTGAAAAGVAYLFSTNGTLLTTFTNPTPASASQFGSAVAAVGTDKVLIGTPGDNTGAVNAGVGYLFSTNGTLLTTFTNPTPATSVYFGITVAAVGADKVLIGNPYDDTGAVNAGAACLFNTNGTLLTTFTNPTPAASDYFGFAVAAVGTDKVLIGTQDDDTGAVNAGAAYLFSTNGTLLTTFINPTPAASDWFGYAVAAVGADKVLIGTPFDDTGAVNAGAAYLFNLDSYVYVPGLISAGVVDHSITAADLDPALGIWSKSGTNLYYSDGNVGVGTNAPQQKLHVLGNILASGTITGSSDRNVKQDFIPVDSRAVLEKVATMPITTWHYIADADVRHLGPVAQDFYAAFQVGMDDKHISMVDADGVALAAIQGLNQKVEARSQKSEDRIQALEAENAELKRRLENLEQLLYSKNRGVK